MEGTATAAPAAEAATTQGPAPSAEIPAALTPEQDARQKALDAQARAREAQAALDAIQKKNIDQCAKEIEATLAKFGFTMEIRHSVQVVPIQK